VVFVEDFYGKLRFHVSDGSYIDVCDDGSMSMLAEMASRKRAQNEVKFIFA